MDRLGTGRDKAGVQQVGCGKRNPKEGEVLRGGKNPSIPIASRFLSQKLKSGLSAARLVFAGLVGRFLVAFDEEVKVDVEPGAKGDKPAQVVAFEGE